jgi:hypothetical protein
MLAQASFKLLMCRIHRLDALGVNQIGYRFGLIQIQFSVQKSTLGKFAGLGGTNACSKMVSKTDCVTSTPP